MNPITPGVERLEPRIAPADITINAAARFATWNDHDGDLVTLKWTTAAAPVFFKTDSGTGLSVDRILLNVVEHSNISLTLSVKASPLGDGRIDLGRVDATGVPLKKWSSPKATVAEFDAGNGTNGAASLTVAAMGTSPLSLFVGANGDGVSSILGKSGSVLVNGDIRETRLEIKGSLISRVSILGGLHGESVGPDGGGVLIVDALRVGSVTIGGSIIGGDAAEEGGIGINGNITKLIVKGSVVGGKAAQTGAILTNGKVGSFIIGGDVIGGADSSAGFVAVSNASFFRLGGSLFSGKLGGSGSILINDTKRAEIRGSVVGGMGTTATSTGLSGALLLAGRVESITIGGNLQAGFFESGTKLPYNGAIVSLGSVGAITIKGNILGNEDTDAVVSALGVPPATPGNYHAIGKLTVRGNVSFGYIAAGHNADLVSPTSYIGNAENSDAGIGSVFVGGHWFHSNLNAGINDPTSNGVDTAGTRNAGDPNRMAVIGPVVIRGMVLDDPGIIGVSGFSAEKIASITVGGVRVFKSGDPARSLDASSQIDIYEV